MDTAERQFELERMSREAPTQYWRSLDFAKLALAELGAALRAWHADARASGREIAWPEIVRGFAEPVAASKIAPDPRIGPNPHDRQNRHSQGCWAASSAA